MGLFGFNKKYDVLPKENSLKGIVTNFNSNVSKIKINAKLNVPRNYYFIIGKKGKVTDKFDEGEHFFNYGNLPYLCRKFGIDKIKKGKQSDEISADLYFVSKEVFGAKFKTYRKVDLGTRAYGLFKAHVIGVYSYKVQDVREFMQSLLNIYDYVKTGEAEDIIESWVNEIIVEDLEKNNYILPDVIANNPIIEQNLKTAVEKLFKVAGLELLEFKITRYKLSKEYQEASDKIMLGNVSGNKEIIEDSSTQLEFNDSTSLDEIIEENNSEKEDTEENSDIKEINETNKTNEEQEDEYIPFGNFAFGNNSVSKVKNKNITVKPQRTFVDLNLDTLYDSNDHKNLKRCLNCGAENNLDANHCILCGEKFNKEYL